MYSIEFPAYFSGTVFDAQIDFNSLHQLAKMRLAVITI
jgi:hypothetical protein